MFKIGNKVSAVTFDKECTIKIIYGTVVGITDDPSDKIRDIIIKDRTTGLLEYVQEFDVKLIVEDE